MAFSLKSEMLPFDSLAFADIDLYHERNALHEAYHIATPRGQVDCV